MSSYNIIDHLVISNVHLADRYITPELMGSTSSVRLRRSKYFKRQSHVEPEEKEVRKQFSEPTPTCTAHILQKHVSYPQCSAPKLCRRPQVEQAVSSLMIRAVAVVDRKPSATSTVTASTSVDSVVLEGAPHTQRASHTPAVRSGPPLSCNFCWNSRDERGRTLRRKTQYHCPECRTNLCIVPCFHEYHDGAPEADAAASAR